MAPPATFVLLSALFVVLVFAIFVLARKSSGRSTRPPGTAGWPFLGETLQFIGSNRRGDPGSFVEERLRKYGSKVFRTSLLGDTLVYMCGPAGNKFLFGNEGRLVALWWPKPIRLLFGRSLINTADLGEARCIRRMLLTFLGPDALQRYVAAMDAVTNQHFRTLWHSKEGVMEVHRAVKVYTFQLACALFTSIEEPEQVLKLEAEFAVFVKGIVEIPINFPGTRFYKAMRAAESIRAELRAVLQQRRVALREERASPTQDLLSHLLVTPDENGRFMTEEEIVNNILTLLFAGHDTATSTITLLVKFLGQLPHVYDQVLQEQINIATAKQSGELLQWQDVQKMKCSWNVVCEVMRLMPPVIGNFREALADFCYEGYSISKGWKLYWSANSTHSDPSLFPDPKKFDASRFEEPGVAPFSFTPFGGGPRMCLGKEYARIQILVFLHNLVKRFKWDLLVPDEKIIYDPLPIATQGLPIRLRPHHLSL